MHDGGRGSAGTWAAVKVALGPGTCPPPQGPAQRRKPHVPRQCRDRPRLGDPGQALKGEIMWPIWGVERKQFLTLKSPPSKPPILRGRSWANLTGGRGDCSSLSRKLPAPGRPTGHCGVAAQVTPPADVDPWGSGELARSPSSAMRSGDLVPLGMLAGGGGGAAGSKEWAERRMRGMGEGRK